MNESRPRKQTLKVFVADHAVELAIALIGILTLVAGLLVGIDTRPGLVFTIIAAIAWTASATEIARGAALRRVLGDLASDRPQYDYFPQSEIYRVAREQMVAASTVSATFFADFLWALQPGERGYAEQLGQYGFTAAQKTQYEEYFRELGAKINAGELSYFWITYVETKGKYRALIDRICTALKNNVAAVAGGHISIHLLPHAVHMRGECVEIRPPVPQVNLQISRGSSGCALLLTPLSNRRDLVGTLRVIGGHPQTDAVIEGFSVWHRFLQTQALAVVAEGEIHLERLRVHGRLVGLTAAEIEEEVQRVVTLAPSDRVVFV